MAPSDIIRKCPFGVGFSAVQEQLFSWGWLITDVSVVAGLTFSCC